MIYTVTLNPSLDRTLVVERFGVGGTYKASYSDLLPAGKGINVARVVATLGEPVVAMGLVGQEDASAFAMELAQSGVENRLLSVPGRTRACVTILDPVLGSQTHVREAGQTPPQAALARLEADLARVGRGDWVVLAGSLPPGVPVGIYRTLVELCTRRGAFALLDANGPPLLPGVEGCPSLLRPNLFELWQVDGQEVGTMAETELSSVPVADVVVVARRVQARGAAMVVVSMGKRGVLGLDRSGQAWTAQTTLDAPVVDVVGSGDALDGGLVVAMMRGDPFPEALRLGVACGAANTLLAGAGRCRKADIERLAVRATVEALQ